MSSKFFEDVSGSSLVESSMVSDKGEYKFNFAKEVKEDFTSVLNDIKNGVQQIKEIGYI